jgi:hypothetical protein
MAIDVSDTIYRRKDVRLSRRICLEQLAKMARPDGTVRLAYSYLAWKMNVCKRTAMRCIADLVEGLDGAPLLRKWVRRLHGSAKHEINTYRFVCKFRRVSAHPFIGDFRAKVSSTPKNHEEKKKEDLQNLRAQLRNQEKIIRLTWVTPGTQLYERTQQHIARLKGLLAAHHGEPAP